MPEIAHSKKSIYQKGHMQKKTMLKGAHAKNSTYKKEHNYHLSQASGHHYYSVYSLTLLGLGLIKINEVSANFNNLGPR